MGSKGSSSASWLYFELLRLDLTLRNRAAHSFGYWNHSGPRTIICCSDSLDFSVSDLGRWSMVLEAACIVRSGFPRTTSAPPPRLSSYLYKSTRPDLKSFWRRLKAFSDLCPYHRNLEGRGDAIQMIPDPVEPRRKKNAGYQTGRCTVAYPTELILQFTPAP